MRPYANAFARGHVLCAQQSKRLENNLRSLLFGRGKKDLFDSILHFSLNATRHQCQVMTNPSLVSVALSIKT